jgi:hypothetical protein
VAHGLATAKLNEISSHFCTVTSQPTQDKPPSQKKFSVHIEKRLGSTLTIVISETFIARVEKPPLQGISHASQFATYNSTPLVTR